MLGACTKEIYLKNRQSGKWMDPPRLLADVKPALDLILANPDVQTSLNALVIRQYPGERNEGVLENEQWWLFDWRGYQVSSGDDLAFRQALRPLGELADHFERNTPEKQLPISSSLTRKDIISNATSINMATTAVTTLTTVLSPFGWLDQVCPKSSLVATPSKPRLQPSMWFPW
jgi:hypothetical protein